MSPILLKIHKENVVSVCDSELIGKCLEVGDFRLEINERFYNGKKAEKKKIINVLKEAGNANIVGKKAVGLALKAGIINEEGVKTIKGIPFAMIFSVA